MDKKKIISYNDLDVYQRAYNACLVVMKKIIPNLPQVEKYDLTDQLSRACKAVPRLIAEGFAKKHQKAGYQKYLDDAMAESNESQVCICQCRDIYTKEMDLSDCEEMIKEYEIIGRQIFKLREAWSKFSKPNLK